MAITPQVIEITAGEVAAESGDGDLPGESRTQVARGARIFICGAGCGGGIMRRNSDEEAVLRLMPDGDYQAGSAHPGGAAAVRDSAVSRHIYCAFIQLLEC